MKNPLFFDLDGIHLNRSGSWLDGTSRTRVSYRDWDEASGRFNYLTFRVFRSQEKL